MRRKEIERVRRLIFDGTLAERLAKAKSWLVRVDQDITRMNEKIRAVVQDYHESREAWSGRSSPTSEPPRIDQEAVAKGRKMMAGAWAARIVEILFAAGLASLALALPTGWAVLLGGVVAFLLAIIFEGAVMRFLRRGGPAQSLRSAEQLLGIAFIVVLLALVPLAIARTVDEAAVLTGPALALLTIMLPLLAGFLGVAAFVLDSSARLTGVYDSLLVERAETEQFKRELKDFIREQRSDDDDATGPPHAAA